MTVRHPGKLKLSFLPLSPNNWGEKNLVKAYFLSKAKE